MEEDALWRKTLVSPFLLSVPDLSSMRRFALCFLTVYICWDIKAVFYAIWTPLSPIMGYIDPRRPSTDQMFGTQPALPNTICSLLQMWFSPCQETALTEGLSMTKCVAFSHKALQNVICAIWAHPHLCRHYQLYIKST